MYASQREELIERALEEGFASLQELCDRLGASPATVRRDLARLEASGRISRLRGGARLATAPATAERLSGPPFMQNRSRRATQKAAIGRAAAALCASGETIILDGGTTTFAMCAALAERAMQVMTNSLPIVNALLPHPAIRLSMPAGTVFREQNIVLSPFEDDGLQRFHADKLFMGAAALGLRGLLQADVILIQAERKLIERADKLVVLVDSSKFRDSASYQLCPLSDIDIVVTDSEATDGDLRMLRKAGVEVIVADV